MSRIAPIDPSTADGRAKPLLDAVQQQLGVTPNMMRTMAQAPAVLEGYLALSGALAKAPVRGALAELVALDVAEANGCGYCLSAHTYLGANVAGLTEQQMEDARVADSDDPRSRAALRFAREVSEQRGKVTDEQLDAVRAAGFDDAAVLALVGHVALNVLTNYVNNVAQTTVDFPEVRPPAAVVAH